MILKEQKQHFANLPQIGNLATASPNQMTAGIGNLGGYLEKQTNAVVNDNGVRAKTATALRLLLEASHSLVLSETLLSGPTPEEESDAPDVQRDSIDSLLDRLCALAGRVSQQASGILGRL